MGLDKEFKTLAGYPLWEALGRLAEDFPQTAIKERVGSGGKLSSINPAYEIERLNNIFGLCGFGWKYSNGEFKIHDSKSEKIEAIVTTEVTLQFAYTYAEPTKELPYQVLWSEPIPACGQGTVHSGMSIGDAHKSAVTDALTKAASMIGLGISVFKGEQTHRSTPKVTTPKVEQKRCSKCSSTPCICSHYSTPSTKSNPQKKADDESSPIVQLWIKAEAADVPPDEWKLWLKEYAITKDRRTQGTKKMELLQKKIDDWSANSRDEKLFISEDEISWLRSTAEASAVDIQGEDGLLKFCQAAINNFELKDLKTLTKDEFDACMKELNERSAEGSEDV